jgi:hypothetical protein
MSRLSRSFSLDGYNNYQSGGGPWSQSGGRHVGARPDGSGSRGAPYAWPQNSYSGYMGGGGSDSVGGNGGSTSNPEMQILMSQVRQLQQKVIELTNSRPSMNDERPGAWPPGDEPMSSGGYSGNHPSTILATIPVTTLVTIPETILAIRQQEASPRHLYPPTDKEGYYLSAIYLRLWPPATLCTSCSSASARWNVSKSCAIREPPLLFR